MPRAALAQVRQHSLQTHEFVHGIDEHQKRQQRDKASLTLLFVRKANRQTHTENYAEVGENGREGTGQQCAKPDRDRIVEEWQHRL